MKPEYKDKHVGERKFIAERHDGIPMTAKGITKGAKEEARNANRSRKKAKRHAVKLELKRYI